jgi:hypothetical protein
MRRKAAAADTPEESPDAVSDEALEPTPFDASDVDLEAQEYVDLGSLLIPSPDGLELQLQVDEESGEVMAVLIGNEQGAVELRAFAASRNGNLWDDARREIAADATRRGGTATHQDGPLGTELLCQIPVTTPDGQAALQPSRVLGHNGPRWFLRATLLGQPAVEPATDQQFVDALRAVVVRRGNEAMAPGEPLPLHLPPQARRID